jgi:hypothetical protein
MSRNHRVAETIQKGEIEELCMNQAHSDLVGGWNSALL